jgi:hypothetical protein
MFEDDVQVLVAVEEGHAVIDGNRRQQQIRLRNRHSPSGQVESQLSRRFEMVLVRRKWIEPRQLVLKHRKDLRPRPAVELFKHATNGIFSTVDHKPCARASIALLASICLPSRHS